MPPRKRNLSQIATSGDEGTPSRDTEMDSINPKDIALPPTTVQRLAKGVIPANTHIQKDAMTAMTKSATLFINYVAHAACASPAMGTRKTISQEAVLDALAELGFESFLPRVEAELLQFKEVQTEKRNEHRRKLKEKEENKTVGSTRGVTAAEKGEGDGDGDKRAPKRVRWVDDKVATEEDEEEEGPLDEEDEEEEGSLDEEDEEEHGSLDVEVGESSEGEDD